MGDGVALCSAAAAAECSDSRAWRTVRRVVISAVSRSSSAFLAPRIESRSSRSPSPDLRNESRIDVRLAGGAG